MKAHLITPIEPLLKAVQLLPDDFDVIFTDEFGLGYRNKTTGMVYEIDEIAPLKGDVVDLGECKGCIVRVELKMQLQLYERMMPEQLLDFVTRHEVLADDYLILLHLSKLL